jgi:predicted amidohydrolase YtcJ
MSRAGVALALVGAFAVGCGGGRTPRAGGAELVLVGGELVTMDPARPRASAIAIKDGRIAAVGDAAAVSPWIGKQTRVVELGGRGVSPGLVDAHCHLYGLGRSLEEIPLRGVASEAEAVERVATAASALPAGEWALGRGWDQNLWKGQSFPTAASLDRALGARPVALRRVDGHALWVNSAALAAAGIDGKTASPPGGKILRDGSGRATGVLIDNAMDLVFGKMPKPAPEVLTRRIQLAARTAVAQGLTAVHEMGIDDDTVDAYRALADQGRLPLRVRAYLEGSPALAETLAGRVADVDRRGDAMFILAGVKFYADGALGSRGARLLAPYDDEPGTLGLWVTEPPVLARAVAAAASAGWQVAIHAIGDAGVRATIEAFEAAKGDVPPAVARALPSFRVEHAQIVALDDVPRMKAVGAVASMQPTHATSDMPWAEKRVGAARIKGAYAWRTMLDAKIPLAFGSDFPVEEVSPLRGLWAAVTRQDDKGQPSGGWYPAQRLSLAEALAGYTTGAAAAIGAQASRGQLVVGQVADLTVYDRPLREAALLETQVDLTVVGGRVVFERVGSRPGR